MFVSYHNHSDKSNVRMLDCICKVDDLVDRAIELNYSGLALTDHECLSASVDFLKARDRVKKEHPDFKFIFGNEIYLIKKESLEESSPKYYHFILLAKDLEGWNQIKQLSSRAWKRSFVSKGLRRVPTFYQDIDEIIKVNPGHVFASTACLGSYLNNMILEHNVHEANQFVQWGINVFGKDNFVLELQPSDSDEQKTCNKVLVKLAEHYGVKYIVTTDTHYLEKEDFTVHSAFLNSKQSSDRETEKFYKYTYMMSENEIEEILKLSELSDEQIKKAIENTYVISQNFEDFDFRRSTVIPAPELPEFELKHLLKPWYDDCECIKHFAYSCYDQDRYLLYLIEQGITDKHIEIDADKANRINTELDVLRYITEANDQPVSGYLNLVRKIEDIIWNSSIIGVSRGSAMSFFINYLIGIVQANPLEYNIDYWRFLNKARSGAGNWPDVDIDIAPSKTETIIGDLKKYFGEDNVVQCATFKTESLKSAILTAARGLGINNDEAQALAAYVPVHRGKIYSLSDCLEGNDELGFEPVENFREKFEQYPRLLETIKKIEGLSTNASIHASAVYIVKDGIEKYNSYMTAPNGTLITSLNMHDSDDCGMLKFDLLRTDAEEKIMKCLDMLLSDGLIEWQGSLKSTYDKYLHPDNLIYDNKEMWENAANGKIANLFQFETPVGGTCIAKTRPENIKQMGAANAVMRLQGDDGKETPIDRYVRFRNDNDQWYLEMAENGLTQKEVQILEKYLKHKFGCAVEQEDVMLLLMDPQVANFSLKDADQARKIIAKKKLSKIVELKEQYFQAPNARKEFLNYVWEYCVEPQLGYSFSIPHDIGYSLIALQEMNLATRWSLLYWQCACLCINSGNSETDFDTEEDSTDGDTEDEVSESESSVNNQVKKVAPNYGKIAKAICDAQLSGTIIELPNINTSQLDFIPDVKNNSILYSLLGINVVNFDLAEKIIAKRPYSSVIDFYEKIQPSQVQMIGLIKAGCFDEITGESRLTSMARYLQYAADNEFPLREKLTSVQLKKAIELGYDLAGFENEIRMFNFKKYIDANCYDKDNRRYILKEESCVKFYNKFLESKFSIGKGECGLLPGGAIFVKKLAFTKIYDTILEKLMISFNSVEGRKAYQKLLQEKYINDINEKYCKGSLSTWEMETMCFYHGEHELNNMNDFINDTRNFDLLPEHPVESEEGGRKKYQCCTIAGTVTDYSNQKHIISILTKHGIVDVRIYAQVYAQYNQKISKVDPVTKNKIVLDDSFFKRGNKLIVHGYRRENEFVAKADYSSGFSRIIGLIEEIRPDGTPMIRYQRRKDKTVLNRS